MSACSVTWEKSARKGFSRFLVCVVRDGLSMFTRNPPPVRRRGGTASPKKGGALRNQSTGKRRLDLAQPHGALLGAPSRWTAGSVQRLAERGWDGWRTRTRPPPRSGPGRLVNGGACRGPCRVPRPDHEPTGLAACHDDGHDDDSTTAGDDHDDCTTSPPPTTTTTTAPAPPPAPTNSEDGKATWYAAAPNRYCASPPLPFGTVLAVGTTRPRRVDRSAHRRPWGGRHPHVVDMTAEGLLADR